MYVYLNQVVKLLYLNSVVKVMFYPLVLRCYIFKYSLCWYYLRSPPCGTTDVVSIGPRVEKEPSS